MDRRAALAPEFKTVDHRLYFHSQHPLVARQQFGYVLEANAAVLRPIFERLEADYRTGSTSDQAWDQQMKRVGSRPDLMWLEGEMDAVKPHYEERLRAARAVEAGAEIILRSMDDSLTSIVVAFTGKERPLDVGEEISPGVRVDRLLDGVGNYIRHRQEWREAALNGGAFSDRQLESIRPLARVISGQTEVDGLEAHQIIADDPFPMLRVLDALSGYTIAAGSGSYETLVAAIQQTAGNIIDAKFPAWWEERRKVIAAAQSPAEAEDLGPRS